MSQVGTTHLGAPGKPATRALVSCAHQATLRGSFLFSYFSKYSKTDKKYFCGFFGVRLLTVSCTSLFSRFWSVPEGLFYVFFRCQSLDNITFNINGHTWDIMLYSLPVNNLRVSTFGIIYFDGSRPINLLDNIGAFPFWQEFSYKESEMRVVQKNIFFDFKLTLLDSFVMPSFNFFLE